MFRNLKFCNWIIFVWCFWNRTSKERHLEWKATIYWCIKTKPSKLENLTSAQKPQIEIQWNCTKGVRITSRPPQNAISIPRVVVDGWPIVFYHLSHRIPWEYEQKNTKKARAFLPAAIKSKGQDKKLKAKRFFLFLLPQLDDSTNFPAKPMYQL